MTRPARELLVIAILMGVILAGGIAVYMTAHRHHDGTTAPLSLHAQEKARVLAADELTGRFERVPAAKLNIRADAAGQDCSTLVLHVQTAMDDSVAEALHYGESGYAAYPGGVQAFARARGFKVVIYLDTWDRWWSTRPGGGWRTSRDMEHAPADEIPDRMVICGDYERGGGK